MIVCSLKAAGVGLTLTAASKVCFIELGWTPAEMEQAEDRIHRIGQEAASVMAYYFIGQGTIDERIYDLILEKRKIVQGVSDGRADTKPDTVMDQLLKSYQEEK